MAAGDDAVEVFAARDAVAHYERARVLLAERRTDGGRLVEPSIDVLQHLYVQLGQAREMADEREEAWAAYETMLVLAREAGNERLEVVSLNHLAILAFYYETDPDRVTALLEEDRRVAEGAGLGEALAETECNMADVAVYWMGNFGRLGPLAEKALASARAVGRPVLVARALTALARVKLFAGRLEEAATHAEEGATLSRKLAERPAPQRTEHPPMLAGLMGLTASWRAGAKTMEIRCLIYLAYIQVLRGRPREGIMIGREVRDVIIPWPWRSWSGPGARSPPGTLRQRSTRRRPSRRR